MYGLTRGTTTLLGAAVAGFLLWLGAQTDAEGLGGYWTWVGLVAAAGLVMALSQLLGGWTKWGWPRVTGMVFLLGFLPALVIGGLVLLHTQPEGGWGSGFAAGVGLDGLAEDLTAVLPALAFGLGLLFGFTFDTTGPRRTPVATADVDERHTVHDRRLSDEPVTAERRSVREGTEAWPVGARASARDRDDDGVDDRAELQRTERRDDS